jgi:recombinational DNA repair protein (RecF pathway)
MESMSSVLKDEVIVLRARRFSESSLVATLLGRAHGRLDVLAKGARREKSPLFGHLDLYQREEVLVYRRAQAGLDLLTEAAFVDEHAGLRFSPRAFAAAGFLADLAAEAVLPGEPQAGLYEVLAGAFGVLAALGEPAARAGLAEASAFTAGEKNILVGRTLKLALLDALGWLGFGLELRRCVVCSETPEAERAVALSRLQGGLVCGKCRQKARDAIPVSRAALAAMRERGEGSETLELALPAGERRRWLRFLTDYCQHALEKPLRGRKVLLQMLDGGR